MASDLDGWTRINPYCIQRGHWSIAKGGKDETLTYLLFQDGQNNAVGCFKTAAEAIKVADELDLAMMV